MSDRPTGGPVKSRGGAGGRTSIEWVSPPRKVPSGVPSPWGPGENQGGGSEGLHRVTRSSPGYLLHSEISPRTSGGLVVGPSGHDGRCPTPSTTLSPIRPGPVDSVCPPCENPGDGNDCRIRPRRTFQGLKVSGVPGPLRSQESRTRPSRSSCLTVRPRVSRQSGRTQVRGR